MASSFTPKQEEEIRGEIVKVLNARLDTEGERFAGIIADINSKNEESKAMHVELYGNLLKVQSELAQFKDIEGKLDSILQQVLGKVATAESALDQLRTDVQGEVAQSQRQQQVHFDDLKQQLQDWSNSERKATMLMIESKVGIGGAPGLPAGSGHTGGTLANPKYDQLPNLKEDFDKEDFLNWRWQLDMHLEGVGKVWEHGEVLMKLVRRSKEEIDTLKFDDIKAKFRQETAEFCITDFEQQGRALYLFITKRLPKRLATICKGVDGMNGFEAYRLVNEEADPVMENVELQMSMEINKLATIRCKTVTETKRLTEILDEKKHEYRAKTGKVIEDKALTQVLWLAMDDSTTDAAALKDMNRISGTYKELKEFILNAERLKTMRMHTRSGKN